LEVGLNLLFQSGTKITEAVTMALGTVDVATCQQCQQFAILWHTYYFTIHYKRNDWL